MRMQPPDAPAEHSGRWVPPSSDPGPVTDPLLVARARAGDVTSFALLVDRHGHRLAAFCRTLMGGRTSTHGAAVTYDRTGTSGADDLFQETVLRAFESLERLDEPASFGAWLLGIAANLAKWWWRREARAPHSLESLAAAGLDLPFPEAAQPDAALDAAQRASRILDAIRSLPTPLRRVLVMHYVEGLSYVEIAAALDLPVTTVKGRLFKSRTRLRGSLPPEFQAPPNRQAAAARREPGVRDTTHRPIAEIGESPMTAPQQPENLGPIATQAERLVGQTHRHLATWHHAAPHDEPLADDASRALAAAEDFARQMSHNYFGTEHALLGLLSVEGGAARVLAQLGVTLDEARDVLLFAIGQGDKPSPAVIKPVPRVVAMLELAVDEARRLGSERVGGEHMLLGLLAVRASIGALILESLGVTYETARRQIDALASGAAQSPPLPPDALASPTVRWALSLLPPGREAEQIRRPALFRGLDLTNVLALLAVGRPRLVNAGETLVAEGAAASEAQVLLRGRVQFASSLSTPQHGGSGRSVPFSAHLGPIVLGPAHLLPDDQPAEVTVTALDVCETLAISREAYGRFAAARPEAAATLNQNIEKALNRK